MGKNAEIILYHTSGAVQPSSDKLEFGELAVSHDNTSPKLFTKKNDGTIAEFVDKTYVDAKGGVKTVNLIEPDENGNVNVSIPIVNKGTTDTTFTIEPDTFYIWDEVSLLILDLAEPTGSTDDLHVYMFQFKSSSDSTTTLSLPSNIIWVGSTKIEQNKIYQVTIVNNVAVMGGASPHIVMYNLNVEDNIGTSVASSNQSKMYIVTDNDGTEHLYTIIGNTSSQATAGQWRVTTGNSVTYTIDDTTYTDSAYLEFRGAGSNTYQNISGEITGPCTITIAGTATNTGRTLTVNIGGEAFTGVCRVTTANSVVVDTVKYTGTGGTMVIYPSAAYKIYDIRVTYES